MLALRPTRSGVVMIATVLSWIAYGACWLALPLFHLYGDDRSER